jgi:hypothetical protein
MKSYTDWRGMKKPPIRIIEIHVHRSKRNKRLGHAVAILFPCNHNKYLGLTLYKGEEGENEYRAQDCKVIKTEDYSVMDKEYCKLCPYESEIEWVEDLHSNTTLDDFADVLEEIDE